MMKRLLTLLMALCLALAPARAQKVGLVLSGGGAKGLTHIGIIRALEENGVPIDYVAGTSMGAIVASLYAMGYSADDMTALISSDDFKRWYTAQVETNYKFYFKSDTPTPEFVRFYVAMDSLKKVSIKLPTNVIDPVQMNIAFLQLYAQSNAQCGGNFDKLFVPFRCVASDVHLKKQVVLRSGDLGDAVRASMTFPLVFKPITINGTLLYDGGLYNNFPADVMQSDFHPDIMIGSVVGSNPGMPEEGDLSTQVYSMVQNESDYTLPGKDDILMTFKYEDVSLLDFDRIDELSKRGYDRAMQLMDTIRQRITRQVPPEEVAQRRARYKESLPELKFRDIYVEGLDAMKSQNIRNEFRKHEGDVFTFEDLKRAYFRLLSDDMISEVLPHAVYHPDEGLFALQLKVTAKPSFSLHLGGYLSSTLSSSLYMGLRYQNLDYKSMEFKLDGYVGRIYNNAQFMARMNTTSRYPLSLRLLLSISSLDYYKRYNLFVKNNNTEAITAKSEMFFKFLLSAPWGASRRMDFGVGLGHLKDRYYQTEYIDLNSKNFEVSTYTLGSASFAIEGNTLNDLTYPTRGFYEKFAAQGLAGREKYYLNYKQDDDSYSKSTKWLQLSYVRDTYHRISRHFRLGWMGQVVYGTKHFSQNYTASKIHALAFSPTPYSKLAYNEAFRDNSFAGVGLKPIYVINDMFHVRSEFYGYFPLQPIECDSRMQPYYGKAFTHVQCMAEASVVCQLPIGPLSLFVNYFSAPKDNWNVGLTFGWVLFNNRFIE